jgi:hypothetical protein
VASVLSAPPEAMDPCAAGTKVPMKLWEKFGLATPGWFRSQAGEPRYKKLSRATRFRLALEEADGLFPVFGKFLAGRADLLPSAYLYELRKIQPAETGPSPAALEGELAKRLSGVVPLRRTPGADVFEAVYDRRLVVIELYRERPSQTLDKSWEQFTRKIRLLEGGPEATISKPSVLEQFWTWLELQADIERKRTILGNLNHLPESTVTRFPSLVADLQSPLCLAYEAMEGSPLDTEIRAESSTREKSFEIWAEGILEQSLLLSMVDIELAAESYAILPGGRLGYRWLPTWIPVPVEWHYELLQYVGASSAGNTPRALHMLGRMSSGPDSFAGEQQLLTQLSSLQPELKINAVTPESVTVFENYWRALARTPLQAPLFLHLFHRNVTMLGQHIETIAPSGDLFAQALWPVMGRVLRFHLGDILSNGKMKDWAISSALAFLAAIRQMAVALERIRENKSELTEMPPARSNDSRSRERNRRTAAVIRSAILLAAFLFSVQWSLGPGGAAAPLLAKSAAVAAAAALCFSIAGIR